MADRYWVGGTGTWNTTSTTNWSTTSGGAGGASAPTSADNVIIDANSGTGTITLSTTNGVSVCYDLTVTATQAIALGNNALQFINTYGSITYPATGSFTNVVRVEMYANDANIKTITQNGKAFATAAGFNGTGTFVLGSAFSCANIFIGGSPTIDVSTNNYSISCFGWNNSNNTAFTFVPRAGTISVTGLTFNGSSKTFYNVAFTSTALTTTTITGTNTFNNLTFASRAAAGIGTVSLGANQTINGTLTAQSGNTNPTKRVQFASDVVGTQRTITAAAIDIQCADFRDINAAGAATWDDSTRSKFWGDCLNNSGITFNAGRTVYRKGTGNWSATQWSDTSGGTVAAQWFPLAQDSMVFDANTVTGTHTVDSGWNLGTLTMTNSTVVTLATGTTAPSFYSDVTLSSNVTPSGTNVIIFAGQSRTQTITSAGVNWPQSITINAPNGTVKTQDALTMDSARTLTLTAGTLDLNNNTLTCGLFNSNNSNTRSIAFGTGNITITGNNASVWTTLTATNLTVTGTPTVNLTYSGSTGTRIVSPGLGISEANALSFNFSAGSDTIVLASTHSLRNVNFTGFTGTLPLFYLTVYGNVTFQSSGTSSPFGVTLTFAATSGTQKIITNGQTLDFTITKDGAGTLQLQDALTLGTTRTFTHTAGTVDLNGKTLTAPTAYSTSNSNVRSINFGSGGIISLPGSGTAFNAATATNLTTSGTGRIDMTSASAKTFAGGGASYPMLNQGGAGALTVTGTNTFQDILNTVRGASIVLPASTTTTVNNLSLNGSSGNLVAITSSVSGSKARIEKTSGQVGLQYCSLKDIQAQGGAKFRAPSNYGNTNVSGNAGWDFGALNTTQDNFMFFFGDTVR